jgi:hypothetical protein
MSVWHIKCPFGILNDASMSVRSLASELVRGRLSTIKGVSMPLESPFVYVFKFPFYTMQTYPGPNERSGSPEGLRINKTINIHAKFTLMYFQLNNSMFSGTELISDLMHIMAYLVTMHTMAYLCILWLTSGFGRD